MSSSGQATNKRQKEKKNRCVKFFRKKDILLQHKFFEPMMTDLKYLQQMTGNDSTRMKEMIELFLNQLAEIRLDIRTLLERKNWGELSRLAHKIKSSSLVMGIEQMVKDMKELELLAKAGKNIEKYPDYIVRFMSMSDSVEMELRTYLDSPK